MYKTDCLSSNHYIAGENVAHIHAFTSPYVSGKVGNTRISGSDFKEARITGGVGSASLEDDLKS